MQWIQDGTEDGKDRSMEKIGQTRVKEYSDGGTGHCKGGALCCPAKCSMIERNRMVATKLL